MMQSYIKLVATIVISLVSLVSLVSSRAFAQDQAEAITTIGLGALDINTRQIVIYVPRNTLLYNIGNKVTQKNRDYYKATTHDGHTYYFLEDGFDKDLETYKKYEFLINRELPACNKQADCFSVWTHWDNGRRGIVGKWETMYPAVGGVYKDSGSLPSDDAIIPVKLHVSGKWKNYFIPNRKNNRLIEDLGYYLVLKRKYPLYKFEEYSPESLNTVCNQQTKNVSINQIETEINLAAGIGASAEVTPTLGMPFLKPLLKIVGIDAKLEASVEADGRIKIFNSDENETTISYGANGQSWHHKIVTLKKLDPSTNAYKEIGKVLLKKTFVCSGSDSTGTENVRTEVYLGDIDTGIDFAIPFFDANFNGQFINHLGLRNNPSYKEVLSIGYDPQDELEPNIHQADYNRFMRFMTGENALPPTISHLILKEINRSPSLDP